MPDVILQADSTDVQFGPGVSFPGTELLYADQDQPNQIWQFHNLEQYDYFAVAIAWTGATVGDSTYRLQRSVDGTNWKDYDDSEWSDSSNTKNITLADGNDIHEIVNRVPPYLRLIFTNSTNDIAINLTVSGFGKKKR